MRLEDCRLNFPGEWRPEVSKVFTFITQVEVQILGFKKTFVEVEVSTQAFYSSRSVKVLASKLLKVKK